MEFFRWSARLAAGALVAGRIAAQEPTPAPPAPSERPLSLEGAIAIAIEANETLFAARLKVPLARAAVDVAREIPNPDLIVETAKETPHDALTLAFPIESAGKRDRRTRVAEAGAASAEAELQHGVLGIRNEVRLAFYTLVAAQDRLARAVELQLLAERVHGAAQARFESGAAPRLEEIQADLSAAQTKNDVLAVQGSVTVARSELNVRLARPPDRPTVIAGSLDAGEVPESAAAERMALASSSELALLDRRILEESARVELARAEQYPDPVIQGTLTHRAEPEFNWGWRAGVAVTLPIFQHHAAAVRVEESALVQLQAERAAATARIRGAVFSAAAHASALRDQVRTYRDQMLPKADEVQRMAEDSYRSGQTNLVAMLQAIQSVRDVRVRALQVGLDYQLALAELERAIGAPLP